MGTRLAPTPVHRWVSATGRDEAAAESTTTSKHPTPWVGVGAQVAGSTLRGSTQLLRRLAVDGLGGSLRGSYSRNCPTRSRASRGSVYWRRTEIGGPNCRQARSGSGSRRIFCGATQPGFHRPRLAECGAHAYSFPSSPRVCKICTRLRIALQFPCNPNILNVAAGSKYVNTPLRLLHALVLEHSLTFVLNDVHEMHVHPFRGSHTSVFR